MDAMTDDASHT